MKGDRERKGEKKERKRKKESQEGPGSLFSNDLFL
jgi:hypothetical protein